jgi:hypothetical protein
MRLPIRTSGGFGATMLLWPFALVALIAIVALALQACSTTKVYVPKADLPALHQIVAADLKQVDLSRRDVSDSAWKKRGDLAGRVTTVAVAAGEPVDKAALTAAKPKGYARRTPVAFHADSNTAGDVATGREVRLLFAPTADAEGVGPLSIDALLVSAEDVEAGGSDYVVAVTSADRRRLLDIVARSRLLVVPAG